MTSLSNYSASPNRQDTPAAKPDHADLRIHIPASDDYNNRRPIRSPQPHNATSPTPLLPSSPRATLAIEEVDFAPEVTNKPYPGVDDSFFSNSNNNNNNNDTNDNPDVELIPVGGPDEFPTITSRAGGDDDDDDDRRRKEGRPEDEEPDESDGTEKTPFYGVDGGFGIDIGGAGAPGTGGSVPDVNVYQHKKTLAQGMMDLALLSANANQLRYVLESYERHPYYYPSLVMISLSLILQVAVGIGLIWNATYNIKDEKEICMANRINNFTVSGIFLVTVVNVFVSAFGVANVTPIK